MKQKRLFALLAAGLLLLAAGCSGASSAGGMSQATDAADGYYGNQELAVAPGLTAPPAEAGEGQSAVYQNSGSKLIRRAELTIQTTEFDLTGAALDQLVVDNNGYYESASVYAGTYLDTAARRNGEYIIRVPAERFDSFLSLAGDLGHVISSIKNSDDVSENYFDTEIRLKTQRTKQERLLSLLEQAESMEDIIFIENALTDVEYQIEQLTSTLKHYDALIDYATIRIHLNEVLKISQQVGEGDELGTRISAGISASLEGLITGFQDLLVWGSYNIFLLLFVLAAIGGGCAMILRIPKKPRRKKQADNSENRPEA